jgi:UDP:flavonoid glycosyltransferase YjiC (YdhE family)
MKILLASVPAPGHANMVLAAANILMKHHHDVLFLATPGIKPLVESAGVPFRLFQTANADVAEYLAEFPERFDVRPGLEVVAFDMVNFFARLLPIQAAELEAALRVFPADLILVDSLFFGTLPMLLESDKNRPAIVHLGATVLNSGSGRNQPMRPGIPAEERAAEQQRRKVMLLRPVQEAMNAALAMAGCGPLPCPALESMSLLPDRYLHPGIESFEYPEEPGTFSPVRYIGPLPMPPGQAPLPDWWFELDGSKRLVLVTQGTVANRDFGQLIGPALEALGNEEDLTILVTTGGQPAESIPVPIPANARVASYLPYDHILPRIDLLITNGGYATVNLALAHGIPIVSAGLTEDKEEVSAHVEWAGVGLDLRTNQATPEALRRAARKVLDTPQFHLRASELAHEFARHDTEMELVNQIKESVALTVAV